MKALVVANWKMNPPTFKEAQKLLEVTKGAAEASKVSVVVAPPAIFLRELAARSRGRHIAFAIQHAHFEEGGAHTGEMSMKQARDAKATYVLIGHAERRALGETNDDTRKKVAAAVDAGLTALLCVGETKRTASGDYFSIVAEQARAALADVSPRQLARVVVVYEPLWTIGAETTMSARDMHEMSIFIRKTIVDARGEAGYRTKILYGGSLNADNTPAMMRGGDIQGLLVGRASIDAVEFAKLLRAVGSVH